MKLSDIDPNEIEVVGGADTQIGNTPTLKLSALHPDEVEVFEPEIDPKTSNITAATTGLIQGRVPFAATLAGVGKAGMDAITGVRGPLGGGSLEDIADSYRNARDQFQSDAKTSADANPGTALAYNVLGAAGNPLFSSAKTATGMAGASAIQALGQSDADLTKNDPKEYNDAALDTAGGMLGGGLGYGAGKVMGIAGENAVDYAKRGAKSLGKVGDYLLRKAGKIGANVPEDYTQQYIDRRGNIVARPEQEILDDITGIHSDRANTVETWKGNVENAGKRVQRDKDSVNQLEKKLSDQLADEKYQAGLTEDAARGDFGSKAMQTEEGLKSKNVVGLRDQILDSIKALKDRVTAGSGAGYEALENTKGSVNIQPALDEVQSGLNKLKIRGQTVSDSAANSHGVLSKLQERLSALGDDISFSEAKGIIQQLDKDIQYPKDAGSFSPEADATKLQVRRAFDAILKDKSPEYRQIMEGVAEDTKLLSELSQGFGTDAKVISKLGQMSSQKGRNIDRDLLTQLGKKTGADFEAPIDDYVKTRDLLGSPTGMKALKEGTPEYQKLSQAQKVREALMNPARRRSIQDQVGKSAEAQSLATGERELGNAESAFENSQRQFDPVRGFGPGQAQAKMRALTGARNYGAKKAFQDLDKTTKKNFGQEVKDRAILDSFEKGDTQGSRKTLMGAIAGKALAGGAGALIGHEAEGGSTGTTLGALAGFSADRYAGRVLKSVLNGRIGIEKGTEYLAKRLGPYAAPLVKAAGEGPKSLAIIGSILGADPKYRKMIEQDLE